MPDGALWPKISMVTPSLNQGSFIEETIRSVLLQGYPNIEYIVVDGGSSDHTMDVLRKYGPFLTSWISEGDSGQSNAINKGLAMASGDIANWINSDDYLEKGGLHAIGVTAKRFPDHLLVGATNDFISRTGERHMLVPKKISLKDIIRFWQGWYNWVQPSIFFPRAAFEAAGCLDETLHYVMDLDLYCRLMVFCSVEYVDDPIASFRRHPASKTQAKYDEMMLELAKISLRHMTLPACYDSREHIEQVLRFMLQRAKRLFLEREFGCSARYLHFSMKVNLPGTFCTLASLISGKMQAG